MIRNDPLDENSARRMFFGQREFKWTPKTSIEPLKISNLYAVPADEVQLAG
ncbi:hypothetical protein IMZ48_16935 [Candidatus Bathyarchaeota archaeon]|nr:hypothetical protein [Candidatus Bathyarchaeota archaeon]